VRERHCSIEDVTHVSDDRSVAPGENRPQEEKTDERHAIRLYSFQSEEVFKTDLSVVAPSEQSREAEDQGAENHNGSTPSCNHGRHPDIKCVNRQVSA